METHAEQAIHKYANAYRRLYQQPPRDFHALDAAWVVIDGVQVRVSDLECLTARLECEYHEILLQKRDVVERLIEWCKE